MSAFLRSRDSREKPVRHALLYGLLALASISICQAAELDGVTLPDTVTVGQTPLRLNGIALRTYSFLAIPIYVAGLYLAQKQADADRILQSPEMKLLDIHFIHDVSRPQAVAAWRQGFSDNCQSPCRLPTDEVRRFLAAVPAMRNGDRFAFLFTSGGVEISENGHPFGRIAAPAFAELLLKTFIGPRPPSDRFKRALLGAGLESASRN
jgi:hypothetical protein